MIVAVKRNKKQRIVKFISLLVLICIFGGYYYYTGKAFEEQLQKELENKRIVGQEHVKHVKIIENKVVLVCEINTNLDALIVRYGVMAFVKKTLNEVIIAVDIDFILKSKLNAK